MKTKWTLAASAVLCLTAAATVLADLPGPRWIRERNNEQRHQALTREWQRRRVQKIFPVRIEADEKAEKAWLEIPQNLVNDLRAEAATPPNRFQLIGLAAGLMGICAGSALRWPGMRRPILSVGALAIGGVAFWWSLGTPTWAKTQQRVPPPPAPFTLKGQVVVKVVTSGEQVKLFVPRSLVDQIPKPPALPAPLLITPPPPGAAPEKP